MAAKGTPAASVLANGVNCVRFDSSAHDVEQVMPTIRHAPVSYNPMAVAANATELLLTAEYLLAALERIKGLPTSEAFGILIGACGVGADRIKYAVKRIKETP